MSLSAPPREASSLRRIGAIVRADFLTRFRRLSTLVVFLLLSATAYVWVPDPSTGRALMQLGAKRVIYNSAAIGIGTAMLGSIFIGLAGFYVISNAVKRDVVSRCGAIIASTDVRSVEYLLGKFIGNVAFLSTFTAGFMLASMAMLLVRAEAPLEPLVFANQYLLLTSGTIVFVSVLALVFECIPFFNGRFGDVIYFFLWVGSLGAVANMVENGMSSARYFDSTAFGFAMSQLREAFGTSSISIGSSRFDPKNGTAVIQGLKLTPEWVIPRITSTLAPLVLLPLALLFFHRFDPVRTRSVAARTGRGWLGRLNMLAKPFARPLVAITQRAGSSQSFARSSIADAMLTIGSLPVIVVAAAVLAFMALTAGESDLFTGILPIAIGVAGVLISDISSREKRAGTTGFVFAAPQLQERFTLWKLLSTSIAAAIVLAVPFGRGFVERPHLAPAMLVGAFFVCAAATGLGIISSNPKTFIVLYLTLWYVMANDKGVYPPFDFAGFYGSATTPVVLSYLASGVALLVGAEIVHRRREA